MTMSPRNIALVVIGAILLALTIYFLYRGCSCLRAHEGFEGAGPEEDLTKEEIALFEDLKADKYSAKEIDDMVADGVIDQGLVEKFLDKLDTFEAVANEAKAKDEDAEKEPFAGKRPTGRPAARPSARPAAPAARRPRVPPAP